MGNAASLFDDALIDAATYQEILTEHGYSEEAAKLTVELATFKADQTNLTQQAQLIVEGVKLGQLDQATAQSDLYSLGLPQAAVGKYMLQIETAKIANAKLPTRAELDSMAKKGIIDQPTWEATMQILGYSADWIPRLWVLVGAPAGASASATTQA